MGTKLYIFIKNTRKQKNIYYKDTNERKRLSIKHYNHNAYHKKGITRF